MTGVLMDVRTRSTSPTPASSQHGVTRRRFLAVGLGLSALSLLAACAPSAPTAPAKPAEAAKPAQQAPAATTAPAAAKPAEAAKPAAAPEAGALKAPEPNAKRGGTIKIAGFGDPAHFDLDQSPT